MKIRLNKQIISIALGDGAEPGFLCHAVRNTAFIGHYKIEGLSAINNAMILSHVFHFSLLFRKVLLSCCSGNRSEDYKRASHRRNLTVLQSDNLFQLFSFRLLGGKYVLILMVLKVILKMGTIYVQVLSGVFLTTGMNLTASAIYQSWKNHSDNGK